MDHVANLLTSIESFTMTAGETMALTGLASDTTVNLLGTVTFGVEYVVIVVDYYHY